MACSRQSFVEKCSTLPSALLVVGILLLLGLGLGVVRPAIYASKFQTTTCTVLKDEYTGNSLSCSCGRRCWSSYPCLEVRVNCKHFHLNDSVLLFKDENSVENFPKCSYGLCKPISEDNFNEVQKFKDSLNVGGSYNFLYNPSNIHQVINNRFHQSDEIFHCLFWPMVILVVPAIGLACFIHIRGLTSENEPSQYGRLV